MERHLPYGITQYYLPIGLLLNLLLPIFVELSLCVIILYLRAEGWFRTPELGKS